MAMYQIYGHIHEPIITCSYGHSPKQRPGQFPSWCCCCSSAGLKDGAQFALPPKAVNIAEIIGEQHHYQYDSVCNVVIKQPD
jgi:hypothetical protein